MQKFMKGVAVYEKDHVELVDDIPVPQVGDYGALIRIHACGLCNGTDLHIIDGSLTKKEGLGAFPTILGHEGCGEVVELGPKVRHIQLGDRYIRPNMDPTDKYTMTYGNMAQYGLVVDHQAMREDGFSDAELPYFGNEVKGYSPNFGRIPNDVDYIDGGALLNLCESYNAVHDFGIGAGASVLVYGCGPMGLGNMNVMRALGARRVVAVDGIPERLELAKENAHVDAVINFREQPVAEALHGEKFDFVMDAVGSTAILEEGSQFLVPGGKACSFGVLSAGKDLINLHNLQNNTCVHVHMQPYKRFEVIPAVVELMRQGKLDPKKFYSHVMPLEEIHRAIAMVKAKEALKIILTID